MCTAFLRFQPIVAAFATAIVFGGVALWVQRQASGSAPDAHWCGHAGEVLWRRPSVWIALAGGTGGYWGTMAGAVVVQSILTTLTLAIEPFGRQIIFGLTLLVLMLFYGRQRRLRA